MPEVLFRQAYISYMEKCLEDDGAQKSFEAQMLSYNKLFGKGSFDPVEGRKVFNAPWDLKVSEVTTQLIGDLVTARLKEGLKRSSINGELRYHRAVYRYAVRELGATPNYDFINWRITQNEDKQRFVTWAEEKEILKTLEVWAVRALNFGKGNRAHRLALDLYLFNVEHGLRIGETLLLKRRAFDFDRETFKVYRPKGKKGAQGKTKYATLVLTDRTREVALRRAKECSDPGDPMFGQSSRAVAILRKAINKVCNEDKDLVAEVGTATIHSLRDTFASRLVEHGRMHLSKVADLLGHASPTMTRKYVHLVTESTSLEAKEALMEARANAERRNNR